MSSGAPGTGSGHDPDTVSEHVALTKSLVVGLTALLVNPKAVGAECVELPKLPGRQKRGY